MFSHYATRKISPICKISTFSKDLSLVKPRSHLKENNYLISLIANYDFYYSKNKNTSNNCNYMNPLSIIMLLNQHLTFQPFLFYQVHKECFYYYFIEFDVSFESTLSFFSFLINLAVYSFYLFGSIVSPQIRSSGSIYFHYKCLIVRSKVSTQ